MADEQQQPPKNNVDRKKPDKYLPEELVGEYDKFMAQRAAGEAKFDPATEALLKDIKLAAVNLAATKKAFVAASQAKAEKKLSDEEELEESDRIAKLNEVSVVEFGENALKQLNIGKVEDKEEDEDKKKKDKDGDFLTKLFKAAVPLLAVGGALIGSISQMFKGGPLQGIANILSKGFGVLFDSLAKKIPLISKLLTPIFGEGGFFGKIFSKVGGFLDNIIKGIVGKSSFLTKIFSQGGFVQTLLTKIFGDKIGGKIISAGSKGIVSTLFKGIGKNFLKRLPIIGSLISIGSAITRLKNKDYLGGLVDIGAAFAYMFPGIGTGIGIALDLFNASNDISKATTGQVVTTTAGNAIGDAITWIWDSVKNIIDSGIEWMVERLYQYLPAPAVNTMLKAIGLGQYAKSGLQRDIEELEGKIASGEISSDGKTMNKVNEKLTGLKEKERKRQLKALKKGEISKEDYLQSQVSKLHDASTSGQEKNAIRTSLIEAGFSGEQINEAYIEMKEMLELMKAQQEQQTQMSSPIISQNSQNSNTTNVFQHQSTGTQGDRMSHRNTTLVPA